MLRRDDLQKQIAAHNRRLQKLKEKQATLGISADPSLDIEIEDVEAKIKELEDELEGLQVNFQQVDTEPDVSIGSQSFEYGLHKDAPRIFLCHASEDKPRVQKLYHQLKEAGYQPWLDKYDLIPGQDWWTEIRKVIGDPYNLVVVCLSQKSITKRGVVQKEIKRALDVLDEIPEDTIYLIPARLEPCQSPARLSSLHWVDLFEPDGFDILKRALDFELVRRRPEAPSKFTPAPLAPVLTIDQPFNAEMILIPAGEFLMGTDRLALERAGIKWRSWMEDETPQHSLELPAYSIGRYPVTNAQFAPFIKDGGYRYREFWTEAGWRVKEASDWREPAYWGDDKWNKPDYPVVGVSWYECVAYCRWLSAQTGQPYRLPTEAEWEKAARGSDGRIWPWGNRWNPDGCNTKERGPGQTTGVGHYSPKGDSPYGVADMVGNVWEWCATEWQKRYPYPIEDEWSKAYLNGTNVRVLRGGSWNDSYQNGARCACRNIWYFPYSRFADWGCRVAVSPI